MRRWGLWLPILTSWASWTRTICRRRAATPATLLCSRPIRRWILVYSRLRFFDCEDPDTFAPSATSRILDARTVHLSAGMFRRRIIDRVGPFDEAFVQAEDTDYLLRIFEGQPKYLLSEEIGVFYRKHRGGITGHRDEAHRELMRAFFRAHRRCGNPFLPDGIVTIAAKHLAVVQSWVG